MRVKEMYEDVYNNLFKGLDSINDINKLKELATDLAFTSLIINQRHNIDNNEFLSVFKGLDKDVCVDMNKMN